MKRVLLAVGSHTKYLGGPPLPLACAFAAANCMPAAFLALGRLLLPPPNTTSKPREAAVTFGAEMAALLHPVEDAPNAWHVHITPDLLNLYGAAHGAALAALTGQAAELLVRRDLGSAPTAGGGGSSSDGGGRLAVRSALMEYLSPVRAGRDAELVARLINSDAEQAATFVVMVAVRSAAGPPAKRPILARAKVILQMN